MSTTTSKKKAASKKKATVKSAAKQATAAKARKPAAAVKSAPKKKAAGKTSTRKARTMKVRQAQKISYQTRYQMIQEAAYHIAEKQDFMPDNELAHWLEAETQIDSWIESEKIQLTS